MIIADLTTNARKLQETVTELDLYATNGPLDNDDCLVAWAEIEKARQQLAVAQANLAGRLADLMDEKRRTVDGYATFERQRKTDRKQWDTEELRRAVLDTRLASTETGEILDETPLEKVLAVWTLGAPRVTALRERGLNPDEFCHTERGGWTLRVYGETG